MDSSSADLNILKSLSDQGPAVHNSPRYKAPNKSLTSYLNGVIRSMTKPPGIKITQVVRGNLKIEHDNGSNQLYTKLDDEAFLVQHFRDIHSLVQAEYTDVEKLMSVPEKEWKSTEDDHFFEVQHICGFLLDSGVLEPDTALNQPVKLYAHLGYYINNQRNVYTIPVGINQMKKKFLSALGNPSADPWFNREEALTMDYLLSFSTGTTMSLAPIPVGTLPLSQEPSREQIQLLLNLHWQTPVALLVDLATDMAALHNIEVARLTRTVGEGMVAALKIWLGYANLVRSHLGDSNAVIDHILQVKIAFNASNLEAVQVREEKLVRSPKGAGVQ